jgi:glycosyltransferase involved in cell wall biosynthesis
LPANYLLFVGYLTPKKNLEMVLHAMRRLADEGTEVPLVLVGKRGEGSGAFFALADRLGLKSLLIETGFVTDDELTLIYRKAGALVFPSIYEGFGLPVLEAMACGVPVLASSASSLPELVADPRSLCPPTEPECWVEGIRAAMLDPSVRARAAAQGPRRAQRFSWDATARELRAIYAATARESAGAYA